MSSLSEIRTEYNALIFFKFPPLFNLTYALAPVRVSAVGIALNWVLEQDTSGSL